MNTQDFRNWMARMGYGKHGGQKDAAAALGMSTAMIRRYVDGTAPDGSPVAYPLTLALACSALAMNLPPWGEPVELQKPAAG